MTEHVDEWISAYVDGELNEEQRQRVEKHVLHCSDCQELLSDFTMMGENLQTAYAAIEAPARLEINIMNAIEQKPPALVGHATPFFQFKNFVMAGIVMEILFILFLFGSTGFSVYAPFFRILLSLGHALVVIIASLPYAVEVGVAIALCLIVISAIFIRRLLSTKAVRSE